jgi:hypothetical protein
MIHMEAKRKWNGAFDGNSGGGKRCQITLKARQNRNGERTEPSSSPARFRRKILYRVFQRFYL